VKITPVTHSQAFSSFGREPKKTRKQLYLYRHTHFQALSFSLSLFSQADDKWRERSRAAGADGVCDDGGGGG